MLQLNIDNSILNRPHIIIDLDERKYYVHYKNIDYESETLLDGVLDLISIYVVGNDRIPEDFVLMLLVFNVIGFKYTSNVGGYSSQEFRRAQDYYDKHRV